MKTHQIPIEAYLEALRFMGIEDIDLDETQCKANYFKMFPMGRSYVIVIHFLRYHRQSHI